ncbi:MAG: carbamoyltransferase [Bacteroidota bacterium]
MTILGISCWYHDSAAALVRDGEIVAAAQEERFTRRKHDAGFPTNAIAYCLREAGTEADQLDAVAFYDKPLLKFERLLESYVSYAPRGWGSFVRAMPLWLKKKLWIPDLIQTELGVEGMPLVFPEHHESHAASAFFPSPFERAAFLTIDGVGEWATTSWGTGADNRVQIHSEIHFPHSLGLLYSAFTYQCGFRVNSGEYKLMGLAPYGEPRYADLIREELIDLRADGSFRLNLDYFTYASGLRMTGAKMAALVGEARQPEGPLTQREMDLAASVQVVTEEAVLNIARHVHRETGEANLVMAGGVALNCVANGRLLREGPFQNLWIQPAAGDAGGALGAALVASHHWGGISRTVHPQDAMQGAYLGPDIVEAEALAALEELPVEAYPTDAGVVERTAELLAEGQTVGWMQGRAEFGPRALGHRSILADPRGREVQRKVNLQIKFRESFRPFAPSVLEERATEYVRLGVEAEGAGAEEGGPASPYMLLVGPVRDVEIEGEGFDRLGGITSPVPAVTHVDGSARVQTVSRERNGIYYDLLKAFEARTGCPVLVNTSFNVRGEPIVGSAEDAVRVFRRTHMDALVIGRHVVTKAAMPEAEREAFTPEEIAAEYGLD